MCKAAEGFVVYCSGLEAELTCILSFFSFSTSNRGYRNGFLAVEKAKQGFLYFLPDQSEESCNFSSFWHGDTGLGAFDLCNLWTLVGFLFKFYGIYLNTDMHF